MKRLLLSLFAALTLPAFAQGDFPSRPIRMTVGYAPGGGADIMARLVATKMSELMGNPVIVENRPGNSGIVNTAAVVKSAADGYTLMMGITGLNTIQPNLVPNLPYDPIKDLAPVNLVAAVPHFVLTPQSLPVGTLRELVAYVKANPGRISYPSAGNGTTTHLAGEMFKIATGGLDMVHVPYKSAGHSMPDLISGRVHVAFETLPASAAFVRQGKLRALAVTTPRRLAEFPSVPTIAEAGLPEFRLRTWYGVFAPGGTPAPVLNRLHAEIARAIRAPDTRAKLVEMGADDTVTSTPEEFAALVRAELAHYGRVVKEAGIKLE